LRQLLLSWHTFGTHELALISAEAEHVRSYHIETRGDLREFQEASISIPMNTSPVRTNQVAPASRIQMLTMQEVADRLGVSLQRAYEMGRTGLLPIVRMGRQIRVEETRLVSWIESGGRALPGGWKRYPG
jgi:putative molybdopterin biosynthesis protein